MEKSMYVVLNVLRPGLVRETETVADAQMLAEQFAADDPGQSYSVYELVSRAYGEPPVKAAINVVTKDKAAIEAEALLAPATEKIDGQ